MTKAAFVDLVTADQPDAPPYFTYDAVLNSKERPTLDKALALELNPMTLDLVLALQRTGGQILDTRIRSSSPRHTCAAASTSASADSTPTWAGNAS
jgi:hypothetical protein